MLQQKVYSLSELREALEKSTQEFKPVIGDGVEAADRKNNDKAVKEIAKETEEFDGGVKQVKRNIQFPQDRNKTTLDLDFNETEPGKEWKDRVKAQAEGYVSVQDKKNHENGDEKDANVEREGDKEIAKHFIDKDKERQDMERADRQSGLKARALPKEITDTPGVCESKNTNTTMKRLNFKKTVFLSEADVMSKVPSEYRTDGNKFIMKDASGTEYLMECKKDVFGYNRLSVVNKVNKQQVNEQFERMKQLMGYNSKDYFTKTDKAIEGQELKEGLDKIRGLEAEAKAKLEESKEDKSE